MIKKNIEGFPMYLSDTLTGLSAHLYGDGYHEPSFMWLLRKESEGAVALDIGANIGYSTLSLCENVKKVVAIEPDPRSRKILVENIKLNNFGKKVDVYDFAISDKKGEKTFYLSKHPNLSAFNKNKKYWTKKIKVNTISLDELNIIPNFVKMDIEGFETNVINGGMKIFEKSNFCRILLEVHPQYYDENNNFRGALNNIIKIGYKIKYLISAGEAIPKEFKEKKYKPFKVVKEAEFERGIYKDINIEDAINFSTNLFEKVDKDNKKINKKIVRSVMLEKI